MAVNSFNQAAIPASLGFTAGKNKIINGDFNIWQRGTTFTNPAIFSYTADRWQTILNGSPVYSISRQSFTAGAAPVAGYESQYFLRQNVTTATNATVIAMGQRIEDVRTFAGQTVTFSFWAKADAARTWSLAIDQVFGTGGSTSVRTEFGTISVTTSWQRFTKTATLPSVSGKTINSSDSFLHLLIFGPGETVQTMDIWGVQLEAGSVATAFQTATGTLQGELAACQRYYWRFNSSTNYTYFGNGFAASTTQAKWIVKLPITMRTSPSFNAVNATNAQINAVSSQTITSITLDQANPDTVGLFANCSSGLTAGQGVMVIGNNSSAPYFEFASEL